MHFHTHVLQKVASRYRVCLHPAYLFFTTEQKAIEILSYTLKSRPDLLGYALAKKGSLEGVSFLKQTILTCSISQSFLHFALSSNIVFFSFPQRIHSTRPLHAVIIMAIFSPTLPTFCFPDSCFLHIQRYVGGQKRWVPIANFYNSGIPVVLCKVAIDTGVKIAASTSDHSRQLPAGKETSMKSTKGGGKGDLETDGQQQATVVA
jgi:hypothetical protein